MAQYLVLSVVDAHPGRLNQQAVADRLGLTKGTVSRQIDAAVAAGLMTVEVSPESRREHLVALTPQGTRLVRRGDKLVDREQLTAMPQLSARTSRPPPPARRQRRPRRLTGRIPAPTRRSTEFLATRNPQSRYCLGLETEASGCSATTSPSTQWAAPILRPFTTPKSPRRAPRSERITRNQYMPCACAHRSLTRAIRENRRRGGEPNNRRNPGCRSSMRSRPCATAAWISSVVRLTSSSPVFPNGATSKLLRAHRRRACTGSW